MGSKRGPATMRPVRPASLAVYKTPLGRPPKRPGTADRVRTSLYIDREDLEWFGEAAMAEYGKQDRRNELIERVLKDYRAEVEQAMSEGGDEN